MDDLFFSGRCHFLLLSNPGHNPAGARRNGVGGAVQPRFRG